MPLLVIDREKWGRGNGIGRLLADNGLMCCLGFECLRLGAKPDQIFHKAMPQEIFELPSIQESWMVHKDGDPKEAAVAAATINDHRLDESLSSGEVIELVRAGITQGFNIRTEAQREKLIVKLFASQGVKVEFVGAQSGK